MARRYMTTPFGDRGHSTGGGGLGPRHDGYEQLLMFDSLGFHLAS